MNKNKQHLPLYILFFSLLALISCGLPNETIVKEPNDIKTLVENDEFKFSFSARDDGEIQGYEVYYKIYKSDDDTSITADRDAFNKESSSYTYQFGDVKPKSRGFHRLMNSQSLIQPPSYPMFSTVKDGLSDGKVVLIRIGDTISNEGLISLGGVEKDYKPMRIATEVEGNVNKYKRFFDTVDNNDIDRNGVTETVAYKVALVAYSFANPLIPNISSSIAVYIGVTGTITND